MAHHIVTKNPTKLHLTRRQAWFIRQIILCGNKMAEALAEWEFTPRQPKHAVQLIKRWDKLMAQLVKLLS